MRYYELTDKQRKEYNEFPFLFAFNDKQFKEGMEKLGLTENDTDKIYSIGGGGYIRKTDSKALAEMTERHERELKEAFEDDGFAYDAFMYELGNHEYCITYDYEPTLAALNITEDQIADDKRLLRLLKLAEIQYLKGCL